MSKLWFGLLGSLEVRQHGTAVRLARSKLRVLLATLLLEANQTVPFDRIVERLWGEDPPPSARNSVHLYAMRLRRALGDREGPEQLVQTRPSGYVIAVAADRVDVHAFHDLLTRARQMGEQGDLPAESALLTKALRLWRGPALLDVPSEALQRGVVPRLAEERLQALERRYEVDLRLRRHEQVVGELIGLTSEYPMREGLWLLLMRALAGSGRQVEALEAYRRVQHVLREELGIEPGEPLRRLHLAILAGTYTDPDVATPPLAGPPDPPRVGGSLVTVRVRGDAEATAQASFDRSYDRLDGKAAMLFRRLSAVPGPHFAAPAAAALLGCDLAEAREPLETLLAANLVVTSSPGRYQFHDLAGEYAAARASADEGLHRAETRLWDFYLHTARAATRLLYPDASPLPLPPIAEQLDLPALPTEAAALAWLDSERPNLVAAARYAAERGRRRYAWQLADTLRGYFYSRGHAVEGLAVCDAALAAARADADPRAEAAILDLQGLIQFVLSRYETARQRHEQALQIGRQTGDLGSQATSLHNLGRVHAQLGPPELGSRYHQEALELARQTGDLEAQTLNTNYLGVALLNAGRVDLALQWHLRALELCHRTGNRLTLTRVVGALANTAWYRGELPIAIALYQECLDLARQLGNRYLEANALICLAEAECDAGRYGQAITDAELAVRLGRETGERRHEVGGVEVSITARLRGGEVDGAIEDYRRALQLAREINYRYSETSILAGLVAAHRLTGDPAGAVEHARQALRIMAETGVRGAEARTLVELGHAHLDAGDLDRAAATLDRALALAARAGLRLTEARARYVYGLVRQARDPDAARAHWRVASETFAAAGAPETGTVRALLEPVG